MLNINVVIQNVGGFEIRIHAQHAARHGGSTTEGGTRRKNGIIPVERGPGYISLTEINRATESLGTRSSDGHSGCAGACWIGGNTIPRTVVWADAHEVRRIHRRVEDTKPGPNHSCPFTGDIPGKTSPRREIFAIGLPESSANAWLALLN